MSKSDYLIAGGGPVALSLAAALGQKSDTLLLSPPPQQPRPRHYALNQNSVKFLRSLGAMPPVCQVKFFALHIGNNKTPIVKLTAAESGLQSLCAVASEDNLMHALQSAITARVVQENNWQSCQPDNNGIILTAANGNHYRGRFLAIADGANSPLARLLLINAARYDLAQTALTATVHAPMDEECAAQWFDDFDTLALLPIGGGAFSLIWSLPHNKAKKIIGENENDINNNIAAAASKRTGITINATNNKTGAHPLIALRRAVRAVPNAVFVGDSARTIHPLAGQGLNLGFADAEELAALDINHKNFAAYLRRRENRAGFWHNATGAFCHRKVATAALFVASRSRLLRRRAALLANLF